MLIYYNYIKGNDYNIILYYYYYNFLYNYFTVFINNIYNYYTICIKYFQLINNEIILYFIILFLFHTISQSFIFVTDTIKSNPYQITSI